MVPGSPTQIDRLRDAVRALAQSDEEARAAVAQPDELAFHFDESYTTFITAADALPGASQLEALQQLDTQILSMTGPEYAALWTRDAFLHIEEWRQIRAIAQRILDEFGW